MPPYLELGIFDSFYFKLNFIVCAWMFCLNVCLCAMFVPMRLEKGISSSGTQVIVVVSHLMAPGIDPGSFGRATGVLHF